MRDAIHLGKGLTELQVCCTSPRPNGFPRLDVACCRVLQDAFAPTWRRVNRVQHPRMFLAKNLDCIQKLDASDRWLPTPAPPNWDPRPGVIRTLLGGSIFKPGTKIPCLDCDPSRIRDRHRHKRGWQVDHGEGNKMRQLNRARGNGVAEPVGWSITPVEVCLSNRSLTHPPSFRPVRASGAHLPGLIPSSSIMQAFSSMFVHFPLVPA